MKDFKSLKAENLELQKELSNSHYLDRKYKFLKHILEKIQDIARVGYWEFNILKSKCFWSSGVFKIFGFRDREIEIDCSTYLKFIHRDDLSLVKSTLEDALYSFKDYKLEYRILDREGNLRYLYEEAIVKYDDFKKPLKIYGYVQDTTDIKSMQKQALLKDNLLKTVFNTDKNIIIVTVSGYELELANRAFFKFFNYESLESFKAENRCICDFFKKVDRDGYIYKEMGNLNWIEYIYQNSNKSHKVLIERDSKEYIFKIDSKPIEFDSKNRSVVVFTDITELEIYKNYLEERVEGEIQKRRAQEQFFIEQSKILCMSDMLTSISHHWRQPLNSINLIMQNLSMKSMFDENLSSADIETTTEAINTQVQELSKTLTNFSTLFRESKEKLEFNIVDAISELLRFISKNFEDLEIDLSYIVDSKELNFKLESSYIFKDYFIKSYYNEFRHTLLNILTNSKDFLLKRLKREKFLPFLRVEISKDSKYIYIDIFDNAGGVDKEIEWKIFEPYFSTKDTGEGVGLGLFSAKLIIERNMGGSLSFKNIEEGVKFQIKLPI